MKISIVYFLILVSNLAVPEDGNSNSLLNKIKGTWVTNYNTQIWTFNSITKQATLKRSNANVEEKYKFNILNDKILFYADNKFAFEFSIISLSELKVQFYENESEENLFFYKIKSKLNVADLRSKLMNKSFTISNYSYVIESKKDVGLIQVYRNGEFKQFSNFDIGSLNNLPTIKIDDIEFLVLKKERNKYLLGSLGDGFIISELNLKKDSEIEDLVFGKWNGTFETDNKIYKDTFHIFINISKPNHCFIITNSRVFNPEFVNNKICFYNNFGLIQPNDRTSDSFEYLFRMEEDNVSKELKELKLIRTGNFEYEWIHITAKKANVN